MIVYNNTDGSTGKMSHSSKGNQFKMNIDNNWYKADFLGYEGAAEYVTSELLKMSNVSEFVAYEMCQIIYNDNKLNGCVSKNFLPSGSKIITLEQLFKAYDGKLITETTKGLPLHEKIKTVVDRTVEITGLEKFGKYITLLLELDRIILNEDRHYKNIAVIQDKNNKFHYCPVFDNGAAYLSDMREDYPLEKNVFGLMANVGSKPFSENFDEQTDVCEKLYGSVLELKNLPQLPKHITDEVKEVYGEKVAERISSVYERQYFLYKEYFKDTIKKNIEFSAKREKQKKTIKRL